MPGFSPIAKAVLCLRCVGHGLYVGWDTAVWLAIRTKVPSTTKLNREERILVYDTPSVLKYLQHLPSAGCDVMTMYVIAPIKN